jgi:pimeloyl-ACP methyl ester carboxylesterase
VRASRVRGAGVELAVTEQGPAGAPTLVLVHGYPDTQAVWAGLAAALEARFHVVRYDVRGAGASGAPRGREGYALGHLARDLEAVLDATSGGRPAHVVGHDWGAIQSWEAVTEPRIAAKIASFTAIAGPCLDHVGHLVREHLAAAAFDRLAPQALRSWYVYAFQLPALPELLWRTVLVRAWPGLLERVEGVRGATAGTLVDDATRGLRLYRENVFPRLFAPRERRTAVPVQIVAPRGDPFVTPSVFDGVERWAPRLFMREVEGGHWIVRTHPERVAQWVRAWVDRAEGAEATAPLPHLEPPPSPRATT